MPKVALTDEERRALLAYLVTLELTEPLPAVPDVSQFDPEEGKKLVKKYECFGCHEIEGFENVRPSIPDLGEFARRVVDELDFGTTDIPRTKWDWLRRKLREPQAYESENIKLLMPTHEMTEEEEDALIAYSMSLDEPTLPARYVVRASDGQGARREVSWTTAHLNCNGCHLLDEEEPRIAEFFERKSKVPPTLVGVGGRLQGQYMYQFLLEPEEVRPWLEMRMPDFGFTEAQTRTVVAGFAATVGVSNPYTYVAKEKVVEENFQRGIRRFRHYKCVQCHPTSIDQGLPPDVDPEDLSINLMLTKERLRTEWIRDFMARPKEIAGMDTRMPTVFYTVDGVPKVERPKDDINDITTYMMAMVEPPEVTLAAEEEKIKAEEEERAIDWTQFEY
jgi:mono/diheme cytochrome c family protein